MKIYNIPIDVIATTSNKGKITPFKFKHQDKSIVISKVDYIEESKLAGLKVFIYKCKSIIDDVEKAYELKFEVPTCKWYIYRM